MSLTGLYNVWFKRNDEKDFCHVCMIHVDYLDHHNRTSEHYQMVLNIQKIEFFTSLVKTCICKDESVEFCLIHNARALHKSIKYQNRIRRRDRLKAFIKRIYMRLKRVVDNQIFVYTITGIAVVVKGVIAFLIFK